MLTEIPLSKLIEPITVHTYLTGLGNTAAIVALYSSGAWSTFIATTDRVVAVSTRQTLFWAEGLFQRFVNEDQGFRPRIVEGDKKETQRIAWARNVAQTCALLDETFNEPEPDELRTLRKSADLFVAVTDPSKWIWDDLTTNAEAVADGREVSPLVFNPGQGRQVDPTQFRALVWAGFIQLLGGAS